MAKARGDPTAASDLGSPCVSSGMDRAEEYLKRAAEADAKADQVSDPDIKRQFKQIADDWRALAYFAGRRRNQTP